MGENPQPVKSNGSDNDHPCSAERKRKHCSVTSQKSKHFKRLLKKSKKCSEETMSKFRPEWLGQFRWLAYSKEIDAVICSICVRFSNNRVLNSQSSKQLVAEPFNDWQKAIDTFKDHEASLGHRHNAFQYENTKRTRKMHEMQATPQDTMDKNRTILKKVAETVKFCGRLGISLKGPENNCLALLVFSNRSESLRDITRYSDHSMHKKFLSIFQKRIFGGLSTKINDAKGFMLALKEQVITSAGAELPLCVRYIEEGVKYSVREDFIGFIPGSNDGKIIGEAIIRHIKSIDVDDKYLSGITYDHCVGNVGKLREAQAYIQAKFPHAFHVHSSQRSFNWFISSMSQTPGIIACLKIMTSIHNFFRTSDRSFSLQEAVSKEHPQCERCLTTGWIEETRAVSFYTVLQDVFLESLQKIASEDSQISQMKALPKAQLTSHQQTTQFKDITTQNATKLMNAIKTVEFQICCQVINKCHAFLTPLSECLRQEQRISSKALHLAEQSKIELEKMQESKEEIFRKILSSAKSITDKHDIHQPSNASGAQKDDTSLEDFYRTSVFEPYLNELIADIDSKFVKNKRTLKAFDCLLPRWQDSFDESDCEALFEAFKSILPCYTMDELIAETKIWRRGVTPDLHLSDALGKCRSGGIFPNVHQLLKICTLVLASDFHPKNNSTFQRLESYLRNTTPANRDIDLAVLYAHTEINVPTNQVVDDFLSGNYNVPCEGII